jgi:hypothetical protein
MLGIRVGKIEFEFRSGQGSTFVYKMRLHHGEIPGRGITRKPASFGSRDQPIS